MNLELIKPIYKHDLIVRKLSGQDTGIPGLASLQLVEALTGFLGDPSDALDGDIADAARRIAINMCVSDAQCGTDHFCASMQITNLLYCDGPGFGISEMPLVLAASAIKQNQLWKTASAKYLTALLSDTNKMNLAEMSIYYILALSALDPQAAQPFLIHYQGHFSVRDTQPNPDLYVTELCEILNYRLRKADLELDSLYADILKDLK